MEMKPTYQELKNSIFSYGITSEDLKHPYEKWLTQFIFYRIYIVAWIAMVGNVIMGGAEMVGNQEVATSLMVPRLMFASGVLLAMAFSKANPQFIRPPFLLTYLYMAIGIPVIQMIFILEKFTSFYLNGLILFLFILAVFVPTMLATHIISQLIIFTLYISVSLLRPMDGHQLTGMIANTGLLIIAGISADVIIFTSDRLLCSHFHIRKRLEKTGGTETKQLEKSTKEMIHKDDLPTPKVTIPPVNVLAVDDDPVNLQAIIDYLKPFGASVLTADSDNACLNQIETFQPDIILMDMMMPKLNGYETVKKIRKNHPLETLPIIFLTVKDNIIDLVNGFDAGANDYMTKPLSQIELLARVKFHTDLVVSRKKLIRAEMKYRDIFENAVEGIFQVDINGHIISANPATAKLLGYDTPEALITQVKNVAAECFVDPVINKTFVGMIRKKGTILGLETQAIQKGKGILWVSLSARAVLDQNQQVSYYEGTIVDISDRKQKEAAEQKRRSAEKATQVKSEFIANMGHEIRTPMNAILGFTELLEKEMKLPKHKKYLSAISSSGKTLLSLINDILDLSKIESGRIELQPQQITPTHIFEEIKNTFIKKIHEKKLYLTLNISRDMPEKLFIDDVRLKQVLLNLVGNAVNFTEKGEISLSVWVENHDIPKGLADIIIQIKDTGIGIAGDQLKTIFEPFTQQKGQQVSKYGGTGLGLTITRKLVELMDGSISVNSEAGKGSTFTVTFTHVPVSNSKAAPQSLKIQHHEPAVSFGQAKILVADDNAHNRFLLNELLTHPDLAVLQAENGLRAVNIAKSEIPDLIFMDLKMPVMDGYEATRILKKDADLKHIPVIALTASMIGDISEKAKSCGVDGLLYKPIVKEEMMKEMARFLPFQPHFHTRGQMEQKNKPPFPFAHKTAIIQKDAPIIRNELNQAMEIWHQIKDGSQFTQTKEFARTIIRIGETYHIGEIAEWGMNLYDSASSYNMDEMPEILNLFPDIARHFS